MRIISAGCVVVLLAQTVAVGDKQTWVQEHELAFDENFKRWSVTFELDSFSDVEVAIVDPSTSKIVRHLAAGVLGTTAPPPLIKESRAQTIAWNGFGRIYYPTNIAPRVTVIDNAGNEILHFGSYGNRDSMGGLPGDLVPTKDIPLGFPNSVDATDNYVYVADMVNLRILRLKKHFAAVADSR